mmetsp:Transcript_1324/g.3234  ORF Transcript_1324/g.3234 Transcript_1324/m.3234 type:complete len:99 (+) Transcript_1324:2073-2369(+)
MNVYKGDRSRQTIDIASMLYTQHNSRQIHFASSHLISASVKSSADASAHSISSSIVPTKYSDPVTRTSTSPSTSKLFSSFQMVVEFLVNSASLAPRSS